MPVSFVISGSWFRLPRPAELIAGAREQKRKIAKCGAHDSSIPAGDILTPRRRNANRDSRLGECSARHPDLTRSYCSSIARVNFSPGQNRDLDRPLVEV